MARNLSNTHVTLPNGTNVSIIGIGLVEISSKLTLSRALCIPQYFRFNLLSKENTQELRIGEGREVSNLYNSGVTK